MTKYFKCFTRKPSGFSSPLSRISNRWKDSNLIAVVAVFLLILKALFPQHGCFLLLCLLRLLLLLFLHVIGQLGERSKRLHYSKTKAIIHNKMNIHLSLKPSVKKNIDALL